MGVSLSTCVNLAGETTYLSDAGGSETYTVVRTGGEEQAGWLLTEKIHRCYNTAGSVRPMAHALLKATGWAVHLHNGDQSEEDPGDHACGWRRIGTFWPTRLTGDAEGIRAWSDGLRDCLERLASEQGLPDLYAEHQCNRGAPADFCDACCAQRKAREKKALLDERRELMVSGDDARLAEVDRLLAEFVTPTCHRNWQAFRAADDALQEARRLPATVENMAQVAALQAEMEAKRKIWKESSPPSLRDPEPEEDAERHERSVQQVEAELARAKSNYSSALRSDPDSPGYDRMCANLETEIQELEQELEHLKPKAATPLDAALERLGAKPYHPVYAPLPTDPLWQLPDPLSPEDYKRAVGEYAAPEKSDTSALGHGCAYFDGAPWDICYACEYEKDPERYKQKVRHSQLVQLICAYWRDSRKGTIAQGLSNETLEAIVAFLNTPRADRPYTDEQVADLDFSDWRNHTLLAGLRQLNA